MPQKITRSAAIAPISDIKPVRGVRILSINAHDNKTVTEIAAKTGIKFGQFLASANVKAKIIAKIMSVFTVNNLLPINLIIL